MSSPTLWETLMCLTSSINVIEPSPFPPAPPTKQKSWLLREAEMVQETRGGVERKTVSTFTCLGEKGTSSQLSPFLI